jgi:hypothetical protein
MERRLVKVTWVDAADPESQSWYSDKDVDDFALDKVEVVSLGWVKSETKLYLTLVADAIDNGDGTFTWGRPTKIPFGMIQKVEDLIAGPKE